MKSSVERLSCELSELLVTIGPAASALRKKTPLPGVSAGRVAADAKNNWLGTLIQALVHLHLLCEVAFYFVTIMKHGVAFRKFSRTSSHRMLMLRYVH